eukprot:c37447_g1_i1 orf=53-205(+)
MDLEDLTKRSVFSSDQQNFQPQGSDRGKHQVAIIAIMGISMLRFPIKDLW